MTKKKNFSRILLNVQLFANVELTEGEQARYTNSILRALGRPGVMPLEKYFAKSVSTNAAYSVFYVGKTLEARDRVSNENTVDRTFDDVKGVNAGNLIESIRVIPTELEVPLYIDDRTFDKSQLNEQSAIQDMQVVAIRKGCDRRISEIFKDLAATGTRTIQKVDGTVATLTIPAANKFGDPTKPFDHADNIKAFKRMMKRAKKLAMGLNYNIGIVTGDEGAVELTECEKFTKNDWVNINGETPQVTGDPIPKLLGGYVEELFTFDEVLYPLGTETVGNMFAVIQNSLGQDNKKTSIKPIIAHIVHKKAYFMDVEVSNATELLNPEGVMVFEYLK